MPDTVGRAAIDVDVITQHGFQRFVIKDVGRVHDSMRLAAGDIAGLHGPIDFARTHRVERYVDGGLSGNRARLFFRTLAAPFA